MNTFLEACVIVADFVQNSVNFIISLFWVLVKFLADA